MSFSQRVADYRAATDAFMNEASRVPASLLDRHRPDGWCARQVIHHMADSETQSYVRLRRLVAEPAGSIIQGYDEGAWAENPILGYRVLPVLPSLVIVAGVREASATILERLTEADLARHAVHSEAGIYTLDKWLEIYTRHPREHLGQLLEAIAS